MSARYPTFACGHEVGHWVYLSSSRRLWEESRRVRQLFCFRCEWKDGDLDPGTDARLAGFPALEAGDDTPETVKLAERARSNIIMRLVEAAENAESPAVSRAILLGKRRVGTPDLSVMVAAPTPLLGAGAPDQGDQIPAGTGPSVAG